MKESSQAYTARISSYVAGVDHLSVLRSTPKTIAALLRRRTPGFLKRRSADGKWSIAEILSHLAESEIVIAFRFHLVIGSNGTTIQAFDQDSWQTHAGYLIKRPLKALELFTVLRESNVAFLKSLTQDEWKAFGLHTERGEESIRRMVELYAGHDVNHLRQIRTMVGQDGVVRRKGGVPGKGRKARKRRP